MKKYIIILFLLTIIGFSYAKNYAASTTTWWECTDICEWTSYEQKDNQCYASCCKSNNLLSYGSGSVCCDVWEQLNQDGRCKPQCVWEFYGRWGLTAWNNKCCPSPWIVYDMDSVTDNYASCCEWKQVYSPDTIYTDIPNIPATEDDNLSCCKYWSVVVKKSNWNNTCISCSTLKQEIEWYGSWTLSWEQNQKKSDYATYCKSSAPCDPSKEYTDVWWATQCCDGIVEEWKCITNNMWTMGIDITEECLINGQCKLDIYDTLGIRQSLPKDTRSSPWIFIQDIILSATFFVGTLITWVLIISWLLYVFAWANGALAAKAKKWITWSLVGLVFVVGSYAFVRLIQFLITWWGW